MDRYTTFDINSICAMCISAIIWAGIPITVYGTSIAYLENHHCEQIHIKSKEIVKRADSFYHGKVIGGILHNQTDQLFKNGPS